MPTLQTRLAHAQRHDAASLVLFARRIEFEPEADGDIGYGDPARIAERREQREIREKRQASEARRRLRKMFGVGVTTIKDIETGRSWKWLR